MMQRICPGHTHNIALSHTVLGSRSCVQCTIHAYNPLRPAAARGAPAWLLHDGALNKPLAGGALSLPHPLPIHYSETASPRSQVADEHGLLAEVLESHAGPHLPEMTQHLQFAT